MVESNDVTLSFRLDAESQRHLRALEMSGLTRSEAVQKGLRLVAAQIGRSEAIHREAEEVASSGADRREMLEVASFMESLLKSD